MTTKSVVIHAVTSAYKGGTPMAERTAEYSIITALDPILAGNGGSIDVKEISRKVPFRGIKFHGTVYESGHSPRSARLGDVLEKFGYHVHDGIIEAR